MKKILDAHKDQLRVVFHTAQIAKGHTLVPLLAGAAEAASNQGKFHEMYLALFSEQNVFENQNPTDAEKELGRMASRLGLDPLRFQADLHSDATRQVYAKDEALTHSVGVDATPTFFFLTPSGKNMCFYTTGGMVDYLKDPKHWK